MCVCACVFMLYILGSARQVFCSLSHRLRRSKVVLRLVHWVCACFLVRRLVVVSCLCFRVRRRRRRLLSRLHVLIARTVPHTHNERTTRAPRTAHQNTVADRRGGGSHLEQAVSTLLQFHYNYNGGNTLCANTIDGLRCAIVNTTLYFFGTYTHFAVSP